MKFQKDNSKVLLTHAMKQQVIYEEEQSNQIAENDKIFKEQLGEKENKIKECCLPR